MGKLLPIVIILTLISCSLTDVRRDIASTPTSCFSLMNSLFKEHYSLRTQEEQLSRLHEESFEIVEEIGAGGEGFNLNSLELKTAQLNISEMEGVTRGDGVPYATHPIKLSMLVKEVLGSESEESQKTFLYTMIHDILEEGQGVNREAYERLQSMLPESPATIKAAVILTEPDVHALSKEVDIKKSMLEVVGYARQIKYHYKETQDRALYNASVVDKLFNLFDRYHGVASGRVREEDHLFRMKWRLAKQLYLLEEMTEVHPRLRALAETFHHNIRRRLGISVEEIQSRVREYRLLDREYAEQLDQAIDNGLVIME